LTYPTAVAQLELLGLFDRDAFVCGKPARKRAPTKGEHASLFDATLPHKSDIGGSTANIDEDGTTIGSGIGTQAAGEGIWFSDNRDQCQIEALSHGL